MYSSISLSRRRFVGRFELHFRVDIDLKTRVGTSPEGFRTPARHLFEVVQVVPAPFQPWNPVDTVVQQTVGDVDDPAKVHRTTRHPVVADCCCTSSRPVTTSTDSVSESE
jgi:hypothetical protein